MHARILGDVRSRILSGEWPPGHRIPFEHEFVESYGCSRMTVNKALSRLAEAGLIERRRKSGSIVARPHSVSAVLEIAEVPAEVAALGLDYRFEIVSRSIRRATTADRELIGVEARTKLLNVMCRHDAGGAPFCLERRLVNLAVVPEAERESFDDQPPGSWLLARVPWTSAENRISAAPMSRETAQAMDLAGGTACLEIVRRTWRDDTPVTWVKLAYSGKHELVARFSPANSL
jgi:GntR family transcriptional regulator, histidine utilization repressor